MSATSLLRTLHHAVNFMVPRILSVEPVKNVICNNLHSACNRNSLSLMSGICRSNQLLQPVLPTYNAVCGIKSKGRLQLRCKHCYYVARQERWYVMCKTHPRHKQVVKAKRPYKSWILTSASQCPKRPW